MPSSAESLCICLYVCRHDCMYVCLKIMRWNQMEQKRRNRRCPNIHKSMWQNRKLSCHRRCPEKWSDEMIRELARVAPGGAQTTENWVATGSAQRNDAMKWIRNRYTVYVCMYACMYVCMYVCTYGDKTDHWGATGGAQRQDAMNSTEIKGSPLAVPELHKYVCM